MGQEYQQQQQQQQQTLVIVDLKETSSFRNYLINFTLKRLRPLPTPATARNITSRAWGVAGQQIVVKRTGEPQNYRKEYNGRRNVVAGKEMQTNCRNAAEAETNTITRQQQQQQQQAQQQWLILAEK